MSQSRERRGQSSEGIIRALFDPSEDVLVSWEPKDSSGILRHQLASAIKEICPSTRENRTIEEVLASDHPDVKLLKSIKDWAKSQCQAGINAVLPEHVAKALYTLIVIHAASAGINLTRLSVREQMNLGRWCLAQQWVPKEIAKKIRTDLARIP